MNIDNFQRLLKTKSKRYQEALNFIQKHKKILKNHSSCLYANTHLLDVNLSESRLRNFLKNILKQ